MVLDSLDRKIVQYLSVGTCSYEELARQCNVTRNTIYRRIATLEEEGYIKNTLHCIVNFEQMDLTAVTMGARISQSNQDRAINILAIHKNVKFLWRTYGDFNLSLVAFCDKGKEGVTIQELKSVLEELGASKVYVAVGFVWEKMSFAPFDDQTEIEGISRIIESHVSVN